MPTCPPAHLPNLGTLPTDRARSPWLSGSKHQLWLRAPPPLSCIHQTQAQAQTEPGPASANPIARPASCPLLYLGKVWTGWTGPQTHHPAVAIVGNPQSAPGQGLTTNSCSQIVLPISCCRCCTEGASWPHHPPCLILTLTLTLARSRPRPRPACCSTATPACCHCLSVLLLHFTRLLLPWTLTRPHVSPAFVSPFSPPSSFAPRHSCIAHSSKDIPPRLFFD